MVIKKKNYDTLKCVLALFNQLQVEIIYNGRVEDRNCSIDETYLRFFDVYKSNQDTQEVVSTTRLRLTL